MLNKEQLLQFCACPDPVATQVSGQTFYVRVMTAGHRMSYESIVSKNKELVREALFVLTLCDEQGNLIFSVDDISIVSNFNGAIVDGVVAKALEVNKLTSADVEEAAQNF